MRISFRIALLSAVASSLCAGDRLHAQYTPVFYDGFASSVDSFNINSDVAARQSGVLAPVSYVANTVDSTNDYHHQVFSATTSPPQALQLAGDAAADFLTGAPVFAYNMMASPNYNFKGTAAGGIVGKRITFDLNVGVVASPNPSNQSYLTAGITIGSSTTLVDTDDQRATMGLQTSGPFFSLRFVEDTFGAVGDDRYFLQAFDGIDPVSFRANHLGGAGSLSVQLDIDDLGDGNPFDGSGSTTIDVSVNGAELLSFTRPAGGYADNFITLWGGRDLTTQNIATHLFDNLTVFAAPAVIATDNADFNADMAVDGADFLTWQRGFGIATGAALADGDANGDGAVSDADLAIWQTQFGAPAAPPIGAVPEPASLLLAASVMLLTSTSRRRWS